jgi:hypothetical protein
LCSPTTILDTNGKVRTWLAELRAVAKSAPMSRDRDVRRPETKKEELNEKPAGSETSAC